jgi:hypothetical protein
VPMLEQNRVGFRRIAMARYRGELVTSATTVSSLEAV